MLAIDQPDEFTIINQREENNLLEPTVIYFVVSYQRHKSINQWFLTLLENSHSLSVKEKKFARLTQIVHWGTLVLTSYSTRNCT